MASEASSRAPTKRLGSMLVEAGIITEGQLKEALKIKETEGGFMGKILVELNYIQEATLISFLVKQCKIPHINLIDYEIRPDLFELVPKDVCIKHNLLPIDQLGTILTLAMVDPLNVVGLDEVRSVCPNLKIKPILCSWNEYQQVMRRLFPEEVPVAEKTSMDSFGLSDVPASSSKTKAVRKKGKGGSKAEVDEGIPDAIVTESLGGNSSDAVQAFLLTAQAHIREAVRFGMANIQNQVRHEVAASKGGFSLTGQQFVVALEEAVSESVEEGVGSLLYQMQEALSGSIELAGDLSTEELAAVIRANVKEGIREASGDTLANLTKLFVPSDDPPS